MTMATTFRRAAAVVARHMVAPARVFTGAPLRALSYDDGGAPWSGGGGGGRVGGGGEARRPGGYQYRQEQERRPGDWDCAECGKHVFASRVVCPRCQASKPYMEGGNSDRGGGGGYMGRGGGGGGGGGGGYMGRGGGGGGGGGYMGRGGGGGGGAGDYQRQPIVQRAGDWNCPSCDFHNFASRHHCFRCQESKPHDVKTVGGDEGGWRDGR